MVLVDGKRMCRGRVWTKERKEQHSEGMMETWRKGKEERR